MSCNGYSWTNGRRGEYLPWRSPTPSGAHPLKKGSMVGPQSRAQWYYGGTRKAERIHRKTPNLPFNPRLALLWNGEQTTYCILVRSNLSIFFADWIFPLIIVVILKDKAAQTEHLPLHLLYCFSSTSKKLPVLALLHFDATVQIFFFFSSLSCSFS